MGREVRSPAEPTLAPAVVHEALAGAGAPLPAELLALTQAELGFDASEVRVHTDALAAASARAVRAVAYTVGRHIAFAAGAYAPATTRGRELLRHELQHAAQQGDGGVPGVGGLVVASEGDDERTAEAAERGGFTRARGLRSVRLQRKPEAPQPAVATESLYAEVRAALELADGRRAVLALRRLPAGAGLKLARREPGLRARLAASTQFYPRERVVGLALLAGAKADDWHVRVAAEFVNFRHDGARALLAATGSTGDARALEADFGRDLGDARFFILYGSAIIVAHDNVRKRVPTIVSPMSFAIDSLFDLTDPAFIELNKAYKAKAKRSIRLRFGTGAKMVLTGFCAAAGVPTGQAQGVVQTKKIGRAHV